MKSNFIIIIPARAGSVRLPNKPLTMIHGKSLISRVFELAKKSNASAIYIATDSEHINDHAKSFGADVVMTSSNHKSGMDRIAEAGKILNLEPGSLIINLQGDEPFMPLEIINTLSTFVNSNNQIATACVPIKDKNILNNPNEVKVVRSLSKRAMYFSRSIIPYEFINNFDNYFKHLGIYAYSFKTLQELTQLEQSDNEIYEKLEQLRFLDNGFNIFIQNYDYESVIGIDTSEDLKLANKLIRPND